MGGEFYGMGPVAGEDGENDEDGNLGEELNKPADPVDDENANLEGKLRNQQKEGWRCSFTSFSMLLSISFNQWSMCTMLYI